MAPKERGSCLSWPAPSFHRWGKGPAGWARCPILCGWHPRTQRWLRETITSLKGIWGKRSLTKACTSVTNLTSGPSDSPYLGLGGEGAAENKTAQGNTEGKEAGESSGSFAAPCTVQVQASKISRKQEKRSQGRLRGPLKGGQVAGHRPRLRCAGLQSRPWGPLRQPPPPPPHEAGAHRPPPRPCTVCRAG